jgi:hypothetical protein
MSLTLVPVQYLIANTTSYTSNVAIQFTTDSTTTALLLSLLGPSSNNNYTSIAMSDGINYEIMFITGVDTGAVSVLRAQEGTTAVPLASGAAFRFVWTETSILALVPGGSVTCTGSGGTNVTGGPAYTIHSDTAAIIGGAGIAVSGGWPTFGISATAPAGATGPTGPSGPSTVVTGSGLAIATGSSAAYNVDVAGPAFVAGSGISITGSWPALTFTNTQTPGGAGTVTSISSTTLTVTSPTTTPTVNLPTVGPGAGPYGGITLDANGRVTAVSSGLVTNVTSGNGSIVVTSPSAGVFTVTAQAATTGQVGVTAYAAATNAASNNAGVANLAVTPAGIAAVVAALPPTQTSYSYFGTQTALSAGSYTSNISSFPITVNVPTGESAMLDIYVEVADPSNPTVVPSFAIGLFNSSSLLAGVSPIPSALRHLKYLITGPLAATLNVYTTTLTGTNIVQSYAASLSQN